MKARATPQKGKVRAWALVCALAVAGVALIAWGTP